MRKKPSYVRNLQRSLTPDQRLEQIVSHGMCIGCGICESIAGKDTIEMAVTKDGSLYPQIRQPLTEQTIDRIVSTCPGTRVEGLPEQLVEPDSAYDEVWGIWRQMVMAHASDAQIRFQGSTGGLLTALGIYLVESGEVDFILHARSSSTIPAFGEPAVSRSRQEVIDAAGSRYGPTPTLVDVTGIIDQCEQSGEKFAFIGTPCDVSALRNLEKQDARVSRYCLYQLAMVCGGFMQPSGLATTLDGMGVSIDQVQSLRYRGFGCPGPTRIEMQDGKVHEFGYHDFWGEDDSGWDLPHRCKICPDGIGDAADLAAADAWEGGAPDPVAQHDDPGSNAVIVRSLGGQNLLEAAVAAGYVSTNGKISPRDMDRFQPHQVKKKQSVWARFVGMKVAGSVVPDVWGLRLKPMARRNAVSVNLDQARGGKKRAVEVIRKNAVQPANKG